MSLNDRFVDNKLYIIIQQHNTTRRSLDSRSFFERLLLSRLNDGTSLADIGGVEAGAAAPASSSSSRASPLAYMIGCYER